MSLMLFGCVKQKDIEFFSDSGVVIGKPSKIKEAEYILPITFETKILQSAIWLYDVKHAVKGNEIHITAHYSVPPNAKKSIYKGSIMLKEIIKGTYDIYYININKSKHHIEKIYFE